MKVFGDQICFATRGRPYGLGGSRCSTNGASGSLGGAEAGRGGMTGATIAGGGATGCATAGAGTSSLGVSAAGAGIDGGALGWAAGRAFGCGAGEIARAVGGGG